MQPWWTQSELVGFGTLFAVALAAVSARRRGAPFTEAFALLGLCGVAAAIGGRAWAVASNALLGGSDLFVWSPFAPAGYASAGALLAAATTLAGSRLVYGRDEFLRALDAVVPAGLLGLAFARAGCVVQGCDYGSRLTASWAIHYPNGHPVFESQLASGLIDAGAALSLGVHPFGYYIAIPAALLALVCGIVRTSRRGDAAIGCAVGYAVIRFVAEFWRAPSNQELAVGPFHLGHAVAIGVLAAALGYAWLENRPSQDE